MKAKIMVFIIIFAFFVNFLGIQTGEAFDCMTLTQSSSQADKDFCRNELAQIEAQLAELLKQQEAQKKQTGTLKGDVAYLNSQINALKTKVKARSLKIAQLKVDINNKVAKIGTLTEKIEREHDSLAQLLRNTDEIDHDSLIHLVLSDASISNFYSDLESYSSIKEAVKASVDQIKGIKSETEAEKKDLEVKQDAELDAKTELENSQKKVAQSEAEKKKLLSISQSKEAEYQKVAAEKKARADKIRSALFSLAGTSQKIPFGTALQYANEASAKTGVDPAFVLAVLTQESNLGSNVGKCYIIATEGPQAGHAINISTGKTFTNGMKATRDIKPFVDITGRLGLDPLKTVVSCPIAGVAGYGGAMGPAQFIPSTWKIFESRLQAALGYPANPWSPKDAFMASAMYLTDLGAVGNSASAQHRAACKYYGSGGATCSYSRGVMNHKDRIQADIDLLSS